MQRLRKWRSLPGQEKWLILTAFFWVGLVRLGLWLVRARRLMRLLDRKPAPGPAQVELERVLWAVAQVSRVIPSATCLVQALAGRRLLAAHGHEVELRLGVHKGASGEFQAH